jgi:class 3 adenylate cyclase
MACGSRLAGDGAAVALSAPGAAFDRLSRLVPREYAERLLEAGGKTSGERRVVTILFCDVAGSTAMSEKLDPEDTLEIMNGAFEALVEPIIRYGGTLARFTGDGLLAFFGAPVAHEDDALRACHAALGLIENARCYGDTLRAQRGIAGFNVRVGIHTGLVVVGEVGSDLRVEYTAMGDAVNLAARMESSAEPGTILLTRHTRELAGDALAFEDMGEIRVKGKSEPIHAYRLSCCAAGPRTNTAPSPFVGRDAQLERLLGVLGAAERNRGSVVAVTGEPGAGKTRLLHEARAAAPSVQWIQAHGASYAQTAAYQLVSDLLFRLAAGPATYDDTSSLHPGAIPDARALGLAPSRARDELVIALRNAISARASDRPTVIVLDDLQWADPSSLEVLAETLPLADEQPVTFVCAFRPGVEALEPFSRALSAHRAVFVRVEPLDADSATALLDALLAGHELPADAKRLLLVAAEGNPFFIHEVTRSVIELGLADGAVSAGLPHLSNLAIPTTVRGAITARLDRLPPRDRQILQTAAVIGRAFDAVLLAETLDPAIPGPDLYRRLETMASGGFIHRAARAGLAPVVLAPGSDAAPHSRHFVDRAGTGKNVYVFRDPMITEVCYTSLLKSRRQVLHRRVAEALEGGCTDIGDCPLPVIAYHYDKAGDTARAVLYLRRAATQALEIGAIREAEAFEQRVGELLGWPVN